MARERAEFRKKIGDLNTSLDTIAKRIFDNLQLDGRTKPTLESIKTFLRRENAGNKTK